MAPTAWLRPAVRLAALAFTLLGAAPAGARELFWPAIDVAARLESDGSLSVRETQTIEFTGDWNGGERIFTLHKGQMVQLVRMVRIDPATGSETPMVRGNLDVVNGYDWTSSNVLRWRGRLPTDPEFDHTPLMYRIEYRYTGALTSPQPGAYRLDHDFAFADRVGAIERFSARLELGPGWQAAAPLEPVANVRLAPGRGYVYRAALRFTGAAAPASAVVPRLPARYGWIAVAALALVFLERLVWFFRRDAQLGRFAPLQPLSVVDEEWLETHLFHQRPEVVGAVWDRKVGATEVAAMLARLVQEGKIRSRVAPKKGLLGRSNLFLDLLVPIKEIESDVRPLINGLFFRRGEATDMQSIRAHYRKSGFNPVERIDAAMRGTKAPGKKESPKVTALIAVSAVVLAFVSVFLSHDGAGLFGVGAVAFISLPAIIAAVLSRKNVALPIVGLLFACVTVGAIGAFIALRVVPEPALPLTSLIAIVLMAAACARSFVNRMASNETAESLGERRDYLLARRFFQAELSKETPRLQDRWFPWFVGLGLAPEVDRWMHAFGGAGTAAASTYTGGAGSSGGWSTAGGSASTTAGGWTGGGGSFGGAGATAAFVAGATAMGSGVAAASSSSGGSSSGGGGGAGGSSSGGGGGGGW